MQPKHWTAFIFLGGIWSASFLWIKIALEEIGPNTLVAWRVLFGLLFAGGAVFIQRKAWPRGWAGWFPFLLLGATSVAIPFFLITWGELSIDSAVASILNATVPLFTIVIAHLFLQDDRMTTQKVIGLFIGFVGVTVLLSEDLFAGASGSILGQGPLSWLPSSTPSVRSTRAGRRNPRPGWCVVRDRWFPLQQLCGWWLR